ncbi:uncharacterized protein F4822DRAFT_424747 [Hypoxylon trugodes]|uniref:uncharacterized protein n=1 Tax=Hypoxylon trugodes TaxID=326681 RepID=UPI00219FF911|nr:uncharacterized protein F4822DRAFT_424747 [Hypoxylon trugodes]KAI1394268.1 hypothetical protein F4822DRAFT_424747 [Hypoxylon trugodes]
MAPNDLGDEPLDLQIFADEDDADDKTYKQILLALVSGELSPHAVAADFDAWVVRESNRRLKLLMERPDPKGLTPQEESSGMTMRMISPDASGYIEEAFSAIARLFSAFPPNHPGQDRIILFIEALSAMPEHRAPDAIPDSSNDGYITLWPFGGNWQALAELFRKEASAYFFPCPDIGIPGSEKRLRWRNLQSAMARLTAMELIDCGFLCALEYILPSNPYYPGLGKKELDGPNVIGGSAIAGAQWIVAQPDLVGRYVYAQCQQAGSVDGPRDMWSAERWGQWKEQFEFIARDGRFDDEARRVAELALRRMSGVELELA